MPASQALLSHAHRADDEHPLSAGDLSTIRLFALPETGPPFDDDPAARASTDAEASRGGAAGCSFARSCRCSAAGSDPGCCA